MNGSIEVSPGSRSEKLNFRLPCKIDKFSLGGVVTHKHHQLSPGLSLHGRGCDEHATQYANPSKMAGVLIRKGQLL